jgi:formate/nitrite transporter FocA (FNT family)
MQRAALIDGCTHFRAWWQIVSDFVVPVLIGNMIGGTALFALLAYAQVMSEI